MPRQSRAPVLAVLLTRPEAQSRRLAGQLSTRFGTRLDPVITPLMAPHFLTPAMPQGTARGLILTAETGVEAAARLSRAGVALPRLAWCVGDRTAEAAQAVGFDAVSAAGDADALIDLMVGRAASGPLWHLRGLDARGDIAARLAQAGIEAQSVVVYRQEPQPLNDRAKALLAGPAPVVVPLYSPRSAALFRTAAGEAAAPLWLAAISPAAGDELGLLRPARLEIADRPDAGAMLDAVARLLRDDPAT